MIREGEQQLKLAKDSLFKFLSQFDLKNNPTRIEKTYNNSTVSLVRSYYKEKTKTSLKSYYMLFIIQDEYHAHYFEVHMYYKKFRDELLFFFVIDPKKFDIEFSSYDLDHKSYDYKIKLNRKTTVNLVLQEMMQVVNKAIVTAYRHLKGKDSVRK